MKGPSSKPSNKLHSLQMRQPTGRRRKAAKLMPPRQLLPLRTSDLPAQHSSSRSSRQLPCKQQQCSTQAAAHLAHAHVGPRGPAQQHRLALLERQVGEGCRQPAAGAADGAGCSRGNCKQEQLGESAVVCRPLPLCVAACAAPPPRQLVHIRARQRCNHLLPLAAQHGGCCQPLLRTQVPGAAHPTRTSPHNQRVPLTPRWRGPAG